MKLDELKALADPDTPRSVRVVLAAGRAVEIEMATPVPQFGRAFNRALQMIEGPQGKPGLRRRNYSRLRAAVLDRWDVADYARRMAKLQEDFP